MTTYTLSSYFITRSGPGAFDPIVSVVQSTVDIVLAEGTTALTYLYDANLPTPGPNATRPVDFPGLSQTLYTPVTGSGVVTEADDIYIAQVTWVDDGGVTRNTIISEIDMSNTVGGRHILFLAGDPVPVITTPAEADAFNGSIIGINEVTSGPYASGVAIPMSTLPVVATTENDLALGTNADDFINTGAGNDTVNAFWGDDVIQTGMGDDVINPGNGEEGNWTWKDIAPGTGADVVDFVDMTSGFAGAGIYHGDLFGAITVNIDGTQGGGTIDKGTGGQTVLTNVQNPMLGDGLNIIGTQYDDAFSVTPVAGGFIGIRGDQGNDTINIGTHDGSVRVTYDHGGVTAGVVANLVTGIVSNDGFGFADTINGRLTEFRGTDLNDSILGSDADERFILEKGTDTLDGGGGTDRLNMERSGVDAVAVDLLVGTANGTWDGVAFSYTLSNVEDIWGSYGNDTLAGNNQDNDIAGSYGSDYITGGSGDDTLNGAWGQDTIDGGDGDDNIDGGIEGGDSLSGGAGNDDIAFTEGGNTIDGGADFDTAELYDDTSKRVDYDLAAGEVRGYNEANELQYTTTLTNIERGAAAVYDGELTVTGTSGDDRFKLFAVNEHFMMDGGNGTDRLELHRTFYSEDDPQQLRGITKEEFLAEGRLEASGADVLFIGDDGEGGEEVFATLRNVEEIRFAIRDETGEVVGDEVVTLASLLNTSSSLEGTEGDDQIFDTINDDTITGLGGEDLIISENGDDSIDAGADDDTIVVSPGNHTVDAGDGWDEIEMRDATSAHVEFDFSDQTIRGYDSTDALLYTTTFTNTERLDGLVEGGGLTVFGSDNNDRFRVIDVAETMYMYGGAGTDRLELHRIDIPNEDDPIGITRAEFESDFRIEQQSNGAVHVYEPEDGGGEALVAVLSSVEEIRFAIRDSAGNVVDDETITMVELLGGAGQVITGTTGDDELAGTSGDDTILALDGDDHVETNGGNDSVEGGGGYDWLEFDPGDHTLDGGDMYDTAALWDDRDGNSEPYVVVNLADGPTGTDQYVMGRTDHTPEATVLWQTELRDIEGFSIFAPTTDLMFLGNDDDNRLRLEVGPDYFFMDGAGGWDTLELHRVRDDDDPFNGDRGLTRAEFEAQIALQQAPSGTVQLVDIADNEIIGALSGVEEIRFLSEDGTDSEYVDVADLLGDASADLLITGTEGGEELNGGSGNDTLQGLGGNDELRGEDGDDVLEGGDGNDDFYGGEGNDDLSGGSGNDVFWYDAGSDTINGGLGGGERDRIDYRDAPRGLNFDYVNGTITDSNGDVDTFANVYRVVGTAFDDTITGDANDNSFSGGQGDDLIDGGDGRDWVWYGRADAGVNINLATGVVSGGQGQDTLTSIEAIGGSNFHDTIVGSDADETFTLDHPRDEYTPNYLLGSADYLDGGGGRDMLGLWGASAAVSVNLASDRSIDARGHEDTVIGIEEVYGSDFNDTIIADSQDNLLYGSGGDDSILGGAGNDTIEDGTGTDTIDAGAGIDTFRRNLEDDYAARAFVAVVDLDAGQFYAQHFPSEFDVIQNFENAELSGNFDYIVTGTGDANAITTDMGNDIVTDGGGDDTVMTGAGNDLIINMGGSDIYDGGAGQDTLSVNVTGVGDPATVLFDAANGTHGRMGSSLGQDTITDIEHYTFVGDWDVMAVGDEGANILATDAGNDTLTGGAGDDVLVGGAGTDRAVFDISWFDADVTSDGLGNHTVTSALGEDLLIDIEELEFSDLLITAFAPTPPEELPAWAIGDPHLQTLDGVGYGFHAVGEYVLLQSDDASGDFMLQARFTPAQDDTGADLDDVSINKAFAFQMDGAVAMIDAGDAQVLSIDGVKIDITDGGSFDVGNDRIFRTADTYTFVRAGDDGVLNAGDSQLSAIVRDGGRMDMAVAISADLEGNVEGLLGDGDGNAANDIALADGTVLLRPLAYEDLYGQYRDDWRVDDVNNSLFTYDTGETLAGFYDATKPGQVVDLNDFSDTALGDAQAAAEAAGLEPGSVAFDAAVMDFLLTGDDSFIEGAAALPEDDDAQIAGALEIGQSRVALSISVPGASDAEVGFSPDGSTALMMAEETATPGTFALNVAEGTAGQVQATWDHDKNTDPSIGVADALDILRITFGLTPSFGSADGFDFIKADVNQDGAVGVADALDVLRYTFGLESEAAPRWIALDANLDVSGITSSNVSYDPGLSIDPLNADTQVNLQGYLLGQMGDLA